MRNLNPRTPTNWPIRPPWRQTAGRGRSSLRPGPSRFLRRGRFPSSCRLPSLVPPFSERSLVLEAGSFSFAWIARRKGARTKARDTTKPWMPTNCDGVRRELPFGSLPVSSGTLPAWFAAVGESPSLLNQPGGSGVFASHSAKSLVPLLRLRPEFPCGHRRTLASRLVWSFPVSHALLPLRSRGLLLVPGETWPSKQIQEAVPTQHALSLRAACRKEGTIPREAVHDQNLSPSMARYRLCHTMRTLLHDTDSAAPCRIGGTIQNRSRANHAPPSAEPVSWQTRDQGLGARHLAATPSCLRLLGVLPNRAPQAVWGAIPKDGASSEDMKCCPFRTT
jgi:hypothetical protein